MHHLPNFLVRISLLAFSLLVCSGAYAGTCDAYQKEADAIEGLVPRIKNGKLISLSIYGEATFISSKRSLISKARTKAELKAKRAFASWLKESVTSKTLSEDLLNQVETTDEKGNISGVAEELSRQAERISSSTSSVLSGIIKLDECVDPNEKFILVRMGWKPSLSKMTADSKSTILSQIDSKKNGKRQQGNDLHTGLRVITITVEGAGDSKEHAIQHAIQQAVSQVFGETFQATSVTRDSLNTTEISGIINASVAIESNSQDERIQSATKGVVKSYRVIKVTSNNSGTRVKLTVKLVKYDKGLKDHSISIVVLEPQYLLNGSVLSNRLTKSIQGELESMLSESGSYNILSRNNSKEISKELNFISKNGDVSERARLGNQVGADQLILTQILRFHARKVNKKVGNKNFSKFFIDADVVVKVLDPATSVVLKSKKVILRHEISLKNSNTGYSKLLSYHVLRFIDPKNKLVSSYAKAYQAQQRDFALIRTEVHKNFKRMEDKHENDW